MHFTIRARKIKKHAQSILRRFRRRLAAARRAGVCGRIKYDCSAHMMLYMTIFGMIQPMSHREFKRRFKPAARVALDMDTPEGYVSYSLAELTDLYNKSQKKTDKRKQKKKKRKKRKLMPSDYAWLLRESGQSYEQVERKGRIAPPSSGHKLDGNERREKYRITAMEYWERRVAQTAREKENARMRRLRIRAGLATGRDVARPTKAAFRRVSLRVSTALYEAMSYGECVSFNWKETPGHERDFLPTATGRKVEVVSVRTLGNDPDYDWISFRVVGLRRFLRQTPTTSDWFWEISLGDRVEEDTYDVYDPVDDQ